MDSMQKFVGRKNVLAEPMTRLAYNEYRGWELPADENGADEGMLVEYIDGGKANDHRHDGYISWSPKEVFVNAYKPSSNWVERVTIEQNELNENIHKLTVALERNEVPESEVNVLSYQRRAMIRYSNILDGRLSGTKIEIALNFGEAIEALKDGKLVARKHWNAKRVVQALPMFLFKQIPAEIGLDVIPKMQSVPQDGKDLMLKYNTTLKYNNQIAVVNQDGRIDGTVDNWTPSISAILAEDWYIL